jgi:HSP20 family protein
MSLIPWEPLADLTQFRRQFDNLFDSFFVPSSRLLKTDAWNPVCKSDEDDKQYTISVELPGVDEKDVAVQLSDTLLTISAKRATETKEKDRSESWSGTFTRSVSLPDTVDRAKIEAAYAKGLLTVKLPKLPQAKPKTIPIKAA